MNNYSSKNIINSIWDLLIKIKRREITNKTKKSLVLFIICFNLFSITAYSQLKRPKTNANFKQSKNRIINKDSIIIRFIDSTSKSNFFGIQVQLKDSLGRLVQQGITDKNGRIAFFNLPSDKIYILNYFGLGYRNRKEIKIKSEKKIQQIELNTTTIQLNEVEIVAQKKRFVVKGDTISYNAKLYKSETDENVGNIIEKLPGAQLNGNKLTIEGDNVNSILLDGKTYIKTNALATLNQIPSDIIYRIEVIDNVSPEDPALQLKSINIVTKPKKILTFGKVVSNYGTNDRFRVAGNYYFKTKNQRLTAIADANNINKEDLMAVDLSPLFEGTNSFLGGGINYQYQSDDENTDLELNLIRNTVDRNQYSFFNQYLISSPEEGSTLNTINTQQTYEAINSYDIVFTKSFESDLHFSLSSAGSNLSSLITDIYSDKRFIKAVNIYDLNSTTSSKKNTLLFDNTLSIVKNFERRANKVVTGREVSLLLNYNIKEEENKDTLSYQYTNSPSSNLGQMSNASIPIKNRSIVLKINENWGKNYLISYNLKADFAFINNKVLTSRYNGGVNVPRELNSALSSNSKINQQNFEASFKLIRNTKKTQTTFGINYNELRINGDFILPFKDNFSSNYPKILPLVSFTLNNEKSSRFKITYKALQKAPQFRQLNPTINNVILSRPFLGEPKLTPEIKHIFDIEYKFKGNYNIQHHLRFNATKTENFIGESVSFSTKDSIINDYTIQKGTQLIQLMNFNHQISANISMNHERNSKKSKYGINYSFRHDLLPRKQNSVFSETKIKRFNTGIYWNFYPTNRLSFNFNSYASYAVIQNSISTGNNQEVLNWNAGVHIKYLLFDSLLLDFTSNSFQVNALNVVSSNNKITSILNFSAKQTLFKKQNISFLFQVHDLLNQNLDITQNPTALYITQEEKSMLGRYILFGFSKSF